MNRRGSIAALFALGIPLWPRVAQTQPPGRVRRIGWLTGGSPKSHARVLEAVRAGLKTIGKLMRPARGRGRRALRGRRGNARFAAGLAGHARSCVDSSVAQSA